MRFGLLAVVLVISVIFVYSQFCIIFTVIVSSILFLSFGTAFTIYTLIFDIDFFPSLNLLVFVLIVALGADDTFIFTSYYRLCCDELDGRHSDVLRLHFGRIQSWEVRTKLNKCDGRPKLDKVRLAMHRALAHAAIGMLITSLTTSIAFISNLASSIIVLRYTFRISKP